MTPKEAITILGTGRWLTGTERHDMAEMILRMKTVVENAAEVALDVCDSCDLEMRTCNGEAFKNVHCPNRALLDAISVVKL